MALRVLITGARGQLGRELQHTAPAHVEAVALDRDELDVASPQAVEQAIDEHRPELIINAAAYTAVDRAEEEPEMAAAVNAEGPKVLAGAVAVRSLRLIHVSTDFVFDGEAGTPYRPEAEARPLGVYGTTKRQGEKEVLALADDQAVIVRTGWVYSAHGSNFVKTMLRLMKERDELNVVADQIGTPTWARGLAETLWAFADRPETAGIYHWSDAGVASWYDFAVAIQEEARLLNMLDHGVAIQPIATSDYPTPARRPAYSVLDKTHTWKLLGSHPVHWRSALRSMLCEL